MITGDVAYDGALCAPEPSASPMIAPSTAAVEHRKDPPHFTPRRHGRRIAPPTLREAGYVSKHDNTTPSVGSALSAPSSKRRETQWPRDGAASQRASASSSRRRYEPHIRAATTPTRMNTRRTRLMTHWMMTTMTHTAMSRSRLFHQPKLFTSPPTSCASQPSPRHPSWSERTRPRSIGRRRCLHNGQRISKTYSQTILLVRELGQRLKQRCID